MTLKDRLKSMISYFEVDDTDDFEEQREEYFSANEPKMRSAPGLQEERQETRELPMRRWNSLSTEKTSAQHLGERQQEFHAPGIMGSGGRTTIDIKFPKKFEEAPDIVNLLLDDISTLIDFQHMSESQARRCLDYLDGACSVLSGNLKKVSNTMWLLTPANVTVNAESIRSAQSTPVPDGQFNFDMDMRRQ